MGADKTTVLCELGIVDFLSLAHQSHMPNKKKHKNNKSTNREIYGNCKRWFDFFINKTVDLIQGHKQQDEQTKRFARAKVRRDNDNNSVDSVVGGR